MRWTWTAVLKCTSGVHNNPLDLATPYSLTIDTHETLKGMQINDPTKTLNTVIGKHY